MTEKGKTNKTALIVVDLQNDFIPGGALAVHDGDQIISVINGLLKKDFAIKVATKDWHPQDHGSFAVNQGKKPGEKIVLKGLEQILWPVHCVQGTSGSDFAKKFETGRIEKVFYKGTDKEIDSYSCFFDNGHFKETGLDAYLKQNQVTAVYFVGLATDYCVKASVLDSLKLGYQTYLIEDGCRGVNLQKNDTQEAIKMMQEAGCHLVHSQDL